MIKNCQEDIDLRMQEDFLHKFVENERQGWLQELESECQQLKKECNESTLEKNVLFCLAEKVGIWRPNSIEEFLEK